MWPIRLCFYQRLSVSLVAGFLIILSLFMVASTEVNDTMKNESSQRLHIDLAKHLVHDNPILQTGVYDYDALKNLFHTLMVLGPSFEFYFVDPQGVIKTYSKDIGEVALDKIDLAPVKEFINGTATMPIVGDDPKSLDKQKIFSAEAVYNNDQLQGYLYVIIGGERYDTIAQNLKRSRGVQYLVLIIVAGSLFLLFALLLLFRFFTAPLKQLSDDMDQFRAGGFDLSKAGIETRPWKDDSRNEVQRLGNSFNQMIEHIDMQLRQLKQTDLARKTMLADLSHDLRTPLANLQGFIETLALKGEQISPEERAEFMQISLKNLHNLKHLIDQIFELAYLEGGHVTLKKESIVLAELLHDIAAKFTFKAENKDLKINVNAGNQNAYVYADIGKLERVLTNLIENAIRHTHAGGSININVLERNEELVVEVKDTGVGISEKELNYIFDARYQASNKEDDAQLHAGLGLAICQKLMILLDSKLEVSSELGKGTSFSFSLSQIKP
ncbi:HAMP domain-containing sensor histidine kinase [Glaciecola sp. KUL10]|uniref:sensor histidine kinase n=1 Tax=Glaciecola sp. (strain KUL10) TaxID=2161813 RepID=UPI000D901D8E|nr:HAMP domain-containing sensor histidine kinase [Glaciecola sp. KUL10]GBL05075.1 periplasmic sensor signal transduction histidine kinase [Glaciecola sp. KUL10]